MFSSKPISDENNEAASLSMIKVIKDKEDIAPEGIRGKSGDITERLAQYSREMDKAAPSDPKEMASSADQNPSAAASCDSDPTVVHRDRAPATTKPRYKGWRKAAKPDDLLSYWAALRHGRIYPDRTNLQTEKIGKFWPNCLLVSCDRTSGRMQLDYEFTKALRQVQARAEEDGSVTEKLDVNAMVIDWVFAQCQEVALSGRPNHASEIFPTHSGESNIRLIALPLSKDQRQIDYILCHLQEI